MYLYYSKATIFGRSFCKKFKNYSSRIKVKAFLTKIPPRVYFVLTRITMYHIARLPNALPNLTLLNVNLDLLKAN